MSFCDNATKFNGQKVEDFNEKDGIENSNIAYRFRINYEEVTETSGMFKAFLEDTKLSEVTNFVIGHWDEDGYETPPTNIINLILEHKDKLQHIKGIFFGDVTYEENEISWIQNCDHGVILDALPNLEIYQVRGGENLEFENLKHQNLKTLIIETGGLDKSMFASIAKADLPKLEHLEVWSGDENYGFNASAEEITACYKGENHLPSLKYLGLRNCAVIDDVAKLMIDDPILDRISVLDFSKGVMGNEGAAFILKNSKITNLDKLNLDHNFISDALAEKLKQLDVEISLEDRNPNPDEYERYVEVAE